MIAVVGDVIEFNNRPVGFITVPSGTMRDDFEQSLEFDNSAEIKELEAQLSSEEDSHSQTATELEETKRELKDALDKIKEIKDLCD